MSDWFLPDGVSSRPPRRSCRAHPGGADQGLAVPDLRRGPDRRGSTLIQGSWTWGGGWLLRDGVLGLRRLDHRPLGRRLGRADRRDHPRRAQGQVQSGRQRQTRCRAPTCRWPRWAPSSCGLGWFGFNGGSQLPPPPPRRWARRRIARPGWPCIALSPTPLTFGPPAAAPAERGLGGGMYHKISQIRVPSSST